MPPPITKGDRVRILYFGYSIVADVIEVWDHGWLLVEQITDYPVPSERPRFQALAAFSERIS